MRRAFRRQQADLDNRGNRNDMLIVHLFPVWLDARGFWTSRAFIIIRKASKAQESGRVKAEAQAPGSHADIQNHAIPDRYKE
jgi:hypothetical protein